MTCPSCGGVNPEGMRFCGLCGRSLQSEEGGRERRRVTVVFVDLAAFSSHTHDQDPEVLRDLADEVLSKVSGIVEDYDGHVDAFRGDGLVALFGAPHSHPDDPQRGVLAAAAALRSIERVGRARGMPLQGRAGVNTGVVIAGSMGPGRVRDYTVMGSAVNLAARLEAAAEPGRVWVGPETYAEARHRLLFEPTAPVQLDGFPEITHVYRLLSTREPRAFDPYAHLPFVGRERECASLQRRLDQVRRSRRARQVWLVGDAGSGKSRLLRETFGPGGVHGGARVLWLRVPTDDGDLWTQLARQLFGLSDDEAPEAARQRVHGELARLLPNEPRWHQSLLASLNLVQPRPYRRLDRRTVDRASLAWRDLLVALTDADDDLDAVVLILDDVPTDDHAEAFVRLLIEARAPLLVVRSGRLRGVPPQADAVRLQPLAQDEAFALLDALVSPDVRPAAHALVQQIGNVPGHVVELGRVLAQSGGVSTDASDVVSSSLAALLQADLDRLDANARRLLAHAAVVGERVWDGLLEALGGSPPGEALDTLVRARLLLPEPDGDVPGEHRYRFASPLLRHAALRLVPLDERPRLHLKTGTWLETNAPQPAFAELTAQHFERAGAPEAAYVHYLVAADGHLEEGRVNQADALFEHLLNLPVDGEMLAQAALHWSQAALTEQDADAALARLERAAHWIGRNRPEADQRLRESEARLAREARALRQGEDVPNEGSERNGRDTHRPGGAATNAEPVE